MNTDEEDIWQTASLRYIGNRLVDPSTVWPSQFNIDSCTKRLVELKIWIDAIEDVKMRKACMGWYEYGVIRLEEARKRLEKDRRVNEILNNAK